MKRVDASSLVTAGACGNTGIGAITAVTICYVAFHWKLRFGWPGIVGSAKATREPGAGNPLNKEPSNSCAPEVRSTEESTLRRLNGVTFRLLVED
mgnify:CR=1 FL=1